MQQKYLASGLLVAVLLPMVLPNLAFAQYAGQAATNSPTLEEDLKLAKARIAAVQANPHAGSGTPFLSGGDVVTAMLISAAVFGTLFLLFVYRAHTIAVKRELESRR